MTTDVIANNIVKARGKCAISQPFWSALMFSTEIVGEKGIGTAATDGRRIYYDPTFFAKLTADETLWVYMHEMLHIVLGHCTFHQPGLDRRVSNIAQDFVINLMLHDHGFKAMPTCVTPCFDEKYRGMTWLQVYEALVKDAQKRGQGVQGVQGDGMGQDVRPDQMTEGQRETLRQETMAKVAAAAAQARMVGKMPGDIEHLVAGLLNPPLPWADVLREYAFATAKDDFSWSRPNRRFQDVILPSRHSERIGDVVLIVDTSGSITDNELAQCQAEMQEIADRLNPSATRVVYCDKWVAGEQAFEEGEPIVLKPVGGGGTDMRVALDHVEQYEPQFVILMTDGYTPWPDGEPPYPLIVCCSTNAPVPVGRVIRMRPS